MRYVEVEVVFLRASEGGREQMPFLDDHRYRPHFRLSKDTELLGVEFVDGPEDQVTAGALTCATVRLVYEPQASYDALLIGTEFEIVEGAKVVGYGTVLRR